MRLPTMLTILAAIAFGAASLTGTAALAQDAAKKTTMQKKATASQKKPGKTCGDLEPNSQAHKDCIAKQAKSTKTSKSKAKKSS